MNEMNEPVHSPSHWFETKKTNALYGINPDKNMDIAITTDERFPEPVKKVMHAATASAQKIVFHKRTKDSLNLIPPIKHNISYYNNTDKCTIKSIHNEKTPSVFTEGVIF